MIKPLRILISPLDQFFILFLLYVAAFEIGPLERCIRDVL